MSSAIDLNDHKREILNGKIHYMSPSANPRHGRVIGKIFRVLSNYLVGKTCEAFTDTIDVYLDKDSNDVVIPDVSVLCEPDKFTNRGYEGVPTLIVEVISPTSVHRDKVVKYKIYEQYGVKEYWLVDPISRTLEIHTLVEGRYQLVDAYAMLEEEDLLRLTEEDKKEVKGEFSPVSFPELVIKLEELF